MNDVFFGDLIIKWILKDKKKKFTSNIYTQWIGDYTRFPLKKVVILIIIFKLSFQLL